MSFIVGVFWTQNRPDNPCYEQALIQKIESLQTAAAPILRLPQDVGFIALGYKDMHTAADSSIIFSDFYGIGHVYAKPDTYTSGCFEKELDGSRPTHLNALKHNYWGRYVGASIDRNHVTLSLIRDPLGLLTLYWMKLPSGYAFASKLSLLYEAFQDHIKINHTYFQDFILDGPKKTLLTPFSPIFEVEPGCELTFMAKKDPQSVRFWNPASIVQKKVSLFQKCPEIIYQEMINRLLYSLKCWISSVPQVCLHLSGGLDSSSLLILLKYLNASENVLALNYKHSSFNASDESSQAQNVADFCGTPFHSVDLIDHPAFRENKQRIFWDRPYAGLIMQETTREVVSNVRTRGDYGFMDGQGGDHLFLMPPPVKSIADSFKDWGLKGSSKTLNQLSLYYRRSIWILAKRFLHSFRVTQENPIWFHMNGGKEKLPWENTWSFDTRSFSFGKKDHFNLLQESVFYRDLPQQYGPHLMLHPLLSLPFVEYVLSLPTYIFFNEAHDRILFRQAMDNLTPNPFVWRQTKGETTSVIIEGLRQNFDYVCGLCLEGYFSQEGFIHRDGVYQALLDLNRPPLSRPLSGDC